MTQKFNIITIFLFANLICIINCTFTCKQSDVIQNFQRDKLLGIWYEVTRNPTVYDVAMKCILHNITSYRPDVIRLNIRGANIYSDKPREENAYLKNLHDINEGLFHVSVDETLVSGSFDLGIIEVDYDSYVIYQGCDYKYEIEYVWIHTKKRIIEEEEFEKYYKLLDDKGIKSKYLVKVYQNNCKN